MDEKRKRKAAVAVKYTQGQIAPKILAKGKGVVAENILSQGKDHSVETYKNEELVNELIKSDIGSYISQDLYFAVAQVLAFISELDEIDQE